MSGYRKPYTVDEERTIVHYIIKTNGYYKLRGLQFWKKLAEEELPSRSYQSLHERFRKYIIHNIQNPSYELSFNEQRKILSIYEGMSQGKRDPKRNESNTVPISKPPVAGRLARDFLLMSDSDDSDDCIPPRTNSNISSNRHKSTVKPRDNVSTISKSSVTKKVNNRETTNSTTDDCTIQDSDSSDSDIFNLVD